MKWCSSLRLHFFLGHCLKYCTNIPNSELLTPSTTWRRKEMHRDYMYGINNIHQSSTKDLWLWDCKLYLYGILQAIILNVRLKKFLLYVRIRQFKKFKLIMFLNKKLLIIKTMQYDTCICNSMYDMCRLQVCVHV